MPTRPRHAWVIAPFRLDRDAVPRDPDRFWIEIDAHRHRCGPYTAGGALARLLAPAAQQRDPALVEAHQVVLLSLAPDLGDHLPMSRALAQLFTFSGEGYPRSWTRRLAHGLADFVIGYTAAVPQPIGIAFEHVDEAEPLDRELIAILLERLDPVHVQLRIGTASDRLDEKLLGALAAQATVTRPERVSEPGFAVTGWRAEWAALRRLGDDDFAAAELSAGDDLARRLDRGVATLSAARLSALAQAYVETDGTSDDPLETRAYALIGSAERRALHRARAMMLQSPGGSVGGSALTWGAIPLHCEQAGDDAELLLEASKQCMHLAYYEAALDWAERGRRLLAPSDRGRIHSELTRNILFARLLLGDYTAVEAIVTAVMASSRDTALIAHASYAAAILNARLYPPARRDFAAARAAIATSLAATETLPPSGTRAVNLAFLRNTLALVEMREGRYDIAHRLLSDAIAYLAKEAPDRFEGESAILFHNRARLGVIRKQPDGAIADLSELLRQQPANGEAYFDRGLLQQRAGRYKEALADYEAAARWTPPLRELSFNRAQVLAALHRPEEAIGAYDHALCLAPNHVETLTNRACLCFEHGRLDQAAADVDRGLAHAPDAPRLLCLRGLLALRRSDVAAADRDFSRALERDPGLADAWANRATVRVKRGDHEGAIADLSRAVALREDAVIYSNRGRVFAARHRWQEALADYERALVLADRPAIRQRRDECLRVLRDAAIEGKE